MKIMRIVVSIIICQLAGVVGSAFTVTAIPGWYAALIKPPFSPPNWLFGPVWLTLYTLMGLALSLVWAKGIGDKKVKQAVVLFAAQLFLNVLWSILFFGLHYTFLAFLEILLMLGFIALTTRRFYRIDRKAAYLMLPYLAWVSLASVLNFSIWFLNR